MKKFDRRGILIPIDVRDLSHFPAGVGAVLTFSGSFSEPVQGKFLLFATGGGALLVIFCDFSESFCGELLLFGTRGGALWTVFGNF